MCKITGKIALITGGGTGIGAAYVKNFFKKGLKGCTIVDIDERGGALAQEMNCCYGKCKAIFVHVDITDKRAFESAFKANMKRFGRLDLLVNNAGMFKDKTWERMIDLNVTSTIQGTLLGIKYMGKNHGFNGGTIVNTSSVVGLQGFSGCPCTAGTKHFVVGFTKTMGNKFLYDLTGIRFLTICPGVTVTPLIARAEQGVLDGVPGLGNLMVRGIKCEKAQSAEHLAESFHSMLNKGENGSIWVCRRGEPIFQVFIPPIQALRKA